MPARALAEAHSPSGYDDRRNDCSDQVAAMHEQARATMAQAVALERLAATAEDAIAAFRPAADAVAHLGDAQKKLCAFLVGNRLKLAASVPIVLTMVGAASPNAAHIVATLLKAWGVQ